MNRENKKVVGLVMLAAIIVTAFIISVLKSEGNTPISQLGTSGFGYGFSPNSQGLCNGNEPFTNECNVNANYLTVEKGLIDGGQIGTKTTSATTTTLQDYDICDNSIYKLTSTGGTNTVTFPSYSDLFQNCLLLNGQSKKIFWEPITGDTVIAAGSGGTLSYTSSSTVAAAKYAIIEIVRDSATTYKLLVTNMPN